MMRIRAWVVGGLAGLAFVALLAALSSLAPQSKYLLAAANAVGLLVVPGLLGYASRETSRRTATVTALVACAAYLATSALSGAAWLPAADLVWWKVIAATLTLGIVLPYRNGIMVTFPVAALAFYMGVLFWRSFFIGYLGLSDPNRGA